MLTFTRALRLPTITQYRHYGILKDLPKSYPTLGFADSQHVALCAQRTSILVQNYSPCCGQTNQARTQKHLFLVGCSNSVTYSQKRYISQGFYNRYLSPEFPPVGFAQKTLETIHDFSGLPWWASIALSTILLRTVVTLPFSVYSSIIMARVEKLQPEFQAMAKELKGEVGVAIKKFGWDAKVAKRQFEINMRRLIKERYIRDNCHPFKATIVAWVQIPMWISMSLAFRNMSGSFSVQGLSLPVLCPDLAEQGTLWFSNMLLADTTFIMPVMLGISTFMIVELHSLGNLRPSRFHKILTNTMRVLSVVIVPVAASVPSCMTFYWTCSSLYGLTQNIVMKAPSVRRALGIPKMPSESSHPYADLYTAAKARYTWKPKSPSPGP